MAGVAAVAVVAAAEVIGVGLTACGRGVRIRMGISPAHVQYGSMRGLVGLGFGRRALRLGVLTSRLEPARHELGYETIRRA